MDRITVSKCFNTENVCMNNDRPSCYLSFVVQQGTSVQEIQASHESIMKINSAGEREHCTKTTFSIKKWFTGLLNHQVNNT